jgi:MATE family, multidrug efflux pump
MCVQTPSNRRAHAGTLPRLATPISVAQLAQIAIALTDSIRLGGPGSAPLAAGGLTARLFVATIVFFRAA